MSTTTPFLEELFRLVRVDRAARELVQAIEKSVDIKKLGERGMHRRFYVQVTGNQYHRLREEVTKVNERCPNIIYPGTGAEELEARLRRLPEHERAEIFLKLYGHYPGVVPDENDEAEMRAVARCKLERANGAQKA